MRLSGRISILLTLLFVAGMILCLSAAPVRAQEANAFDEGLQLYYQKRFKECQKYFLDAMDKDPQDTMALSFYLAASYKSNELVASVNLLEGRSMEEENDANLKAQVGIGYFTRGLIDNNMIEEAANQFKSILKTNPDLPMANTGMGLVYYHKRLIPRAKGYFLKALKSNPKDLMALERLGEIIMIDDQNPKAALEFFNKIIEAAPNYADGYFYAGSALQRTGNQEEAANMFVKCMELDKNGVIKGYDAPLRLGDMYIQNEKWEEAEKYYNVALEINPNNPYAKTMLEKAKKRGKDWKGEKVNSIKDKMDK